MRLRLILAGLSAAVLTAGVGDALSQQAPAARRAPQVYETIPGTNIRRLVPQRTGAAQPAPATGVDWPFAVTSLRRNDGVGVKLGANLNQDQVDQTALPILLPLSPELMTGARLYSFGDYYTLSSEAPGLDVQLSGNAAPIPVDTKLAVTPGPENLVIERTVEGLVASFNRFNVLYTIELGCADPKDTRCTDETLIRDLYAKSTGVVLGKAARKAAGLGG